MNDPAACAKCGKPAEAGAYKLPLCSGCRDAMSQRPFPKWIRIGFGLIVLAFLGATTQLQGSLAAGIAFARGQRAEATKDFATAVAEYRRVVQRFPDSTLALGRLGIVYYRAGDLREAATVFRRLAGRKASKELVREVNQVIAEMERKAK